MRTIDLAGDARERVVWATRPDETIWAPDWILFTPAIEGDPYDPRVRHLRALQPPGDQFWITGRGPVFSYRHNPVPELWNPGMLRNQWVIIDNGLYLVTGVETFRPMISPTNPYGDRPVGILVRPATNLANAMVMA